MSLLLRRSAIGSVIFTYGKHSDVAAQLFCLVVLDMHVFAAFLFVRALDSYPILDDAQDQLCFV